MDETVVKDLILKATEPLLLRIAELEEEVEVIQNDVENLNQKVFPRIRIHQKEGMLAKLWSFVNQPLWGKKEE